MKRVEEIKKEFGKRLKERRLRLRSGTLRLNGTRRKQGMSRQEMAAILGVSPKTVQSWENGRTFIEDLALIPIIKARLGIDVLRIFKAVLANSPK